VADGNNLDGVVWSRSFLHAGNHSGRCHEQSHDDENWDNGPSELYLIAAVHLGRFSAVVILSLPEPHDGVKQQCKND